MVKTVKKPLISVIINCRNGSKFLKECIKSVLIQSYRNWEIIFFDNSSTDNSLEIIQNFKDKRIKIFLNKKKTFLNLYDARNVAIKKSHGKFITFIDVDDLWKKNKLIEQVKLLSQNPSNKIIYSNFHTLENKSKKLFPGHQKLLPSGFITQELLNNYCVGLPTLLISKKIFSKYRFNKKYNIIGDFDLIIRLSKKYEIIAIQKSLAIYRLHSNNFSLKNIDRYIEELSFWLKKNKNEKHNFSLLNYYLLKLRVKKFFKNLF